MNLQLCLGFDCSEDVAVGKAEKKKKAYFVEWTNKMFLQF